MTNNLIDGQQNAGSNSFLAIDAFKQVFDAMAQLFGFFPDADSSGGNRLQAPPPTDVLGNTSTQVWDSPGLNQS